MYILDRYVLRAFTKILLIVFVALTGLFIVIDAFNHVEEFISCGGSSLGVLRVTAEFYGPRVLSFFDATSGLLVQIAAIFVITWLQRTNELTAILAAGVPKRRVVKPVVAAAVVVSLLAAFNREFLIPRVRPTLLRNTHDLLGSTVRRLEPRYDNRTDILFDGKSTVAIEQKIVAPIFRLPPSLHAFARQLVAASAVYQPPRDGRPGGYCLVEMREPPPSELATLPSARIDASPVVLSPHDTPWLAANECFVVSDVDFDRLSGGNNWRRFASIFELTSGLRNPSFQYGDDVRVAIHARILKPLLDLTLLFLGLPLILSRESRNVFMSAGISLCVVAAYQLGTIVFHKLGASGMLNPALAAWGPLLIFAPVATALAGPLCE